MHADALTPEALLEQVQHDIESQRAKLEDLEGELASLRESLALKSERTVELRAQRNEALLDFMKQHALEEERKTQVRDKRRDVAALWSHLESLQAQLAEVNAALASQQGQELAAAERRSRHGGARALVEQRDKVPQELLRMECELVVEQLRTIDARGGGEARAFPQLDRRVAARQAHRKNNIPDIVGSRFDEECLPDDVLLGM
ncbi:hypothetical protein AB1Y20_001409 [Prymnesium parvum]|uniref:Cilia- and flagella-associated protein 157 n=1 Tax=Prymnesium parvum TaxID=97485 RepID=A0AB34K7N8_PRYPA